MLLFLAVHFLEGNVITPLLERRIVRLPPALTMTAQLLLAVIAGPSALHSLHRCQRQPSASLMCLSQSKASINLIAPKKISCGVNAAIVFLSSIGSLSLFVCNRTYERRSTHGVS